MEKTDLVSVIIPVYNVERFLRECLDSVICQTYRELEIILVDDGSWDGSGQICDEYAEKDKRITVIKKRNGGVGAARNRGLQAARGKYIYFLDSDDYIVPDAISLLVEAMEDSASDFAVFNGVKLWEENGEIRFDEKSHYCRKHDYSARSADEMFYQQLIHKEWIPLVQLMFIRREYLSGNQISFYEGIIHEDQLFSFLIYESGGTVYYLQNKMYYRRIHPGSIMSTNNASPKSFYSLLTVYDELEKYLRNGKKTKAAILFAINIAKGVVKKYNRLEDEYKAIYKRSFAKFKLNVLKHGAYGSSSLRMLCLPPFLRSVNEWKIKRSGKKTDNREEK